MGFIRASFDVGWQVPPQRGVRGRGFLRVATVALGVAGVFLVLPAGCHEKLGHAPPALEPLSWLGLELGASSVEGKARLKTQGWSLRCRPARRVLYLDGDALLDRAVRRRAAKRAERCVSRLRSASTSTGRRRAKAQSVGKLLFVDDRLRQMSFELEQGAATLSKELRRRWGAFSRVQLSVFLFGNPRPGSLQAFSFQRGSTTCLWLRRPQVQKLEFFPSAPEDVRILKSLAEPPSPIRGVVREPERRGRPMRVPPPRRARAERPRGP